MIRDGEYIFRRGEPGDKPVGGWGDENDLPTFVLEFKGKQIVAAQIMGNENEIFKIKSFEENKGHCTKFIELWEKYAKRENFSEIYISPVANDALEHILENKLKFSLNGLDSANEKIYIKSI